MNTIDLVAMFRAQLELSKFGPGQTLAILTEGGERADYAEAFLLAAQQLGGHAYQMNLPKRPAYGGVMQNFGVTCLAGNRPAIEALKRADMVVDLVTLLFSDEQNEITAAGARMLLVIEPPEVLARMFPTETVRKRVERATEMLASAKTMKIRSDAGTDIVYELGQYPVVPEYGYTDTPGRWDHWPSGFLFTQGNDAGVHGRVVINRGDILCAFRRYVEEPITLEIEAGNVVSIEGPGLDASLLRNYMASFDEKAYAVSHIGWGLNESAKWHHMAIADPQKEIGMDALAFYGNVLFSTGPNREVGGPNDTPCHVDVPMRGCSLWLDDVRILANGEMVHDSLKLSGGQDIAA